LPVRVACPHCKSVCQVQEQFLGGKVKCGKCAQVFQAAQAVAVTETPSSNSPSRTAPEATTGSGGGAAEKSPPAENQPQQPTTGKFNPAASLGGLWSGLKGVYSSISTSVGSLGKSSGETKEAAAPKSDADMNLDFDGPAAEALQENTRELKEKEPVLGQEPECVYGEFRLDIGRATSPGRVRERNEDSFLVVHQTWSNLETRREIALIVVADGMGGYAAGDRASNLVIQSFGDSLSPSLAAWMLRQERSPPPELRDRLDAAFHAANQSVCQQGKANPQTGGMGATAVAAVIWNGEVTIGHVGDCRAYHFQNGKLKQITRDHTLVARMVELGTLSQEEAERHTARNEVTQAVGKHQELQPDFNSMYLRPGEWLILACDGLHAHVDAAKLEEILRGQPASAVLLTYYLIDLVNYSGGTDNCTVVAVRCY
jgi:predicted Zn finger-like uncharacterized protein